MFDIYGLALYLVVIAIGAAIWALLMLIAFAIGLVTHPIRTLAIVLQKIAGLAAGLALIVALITWFWYDHSKPDFIPTFAGSIGVIVLGVIVYTFAQWLLDRPTRAERRAMAAMPIASSSPLHDAVINGGLARTPWPVKWWAEDENRVWIAWQAQQETEEYSRGDIIVEEYRDIEYGGIERHSESYIHHQHGADPRRLIGKNIALFMNDGILPVVHSR